MPPDSQDRFLRASAHDVEGRAVRGGAVTVAAQLTNVIVNAAVVLVLVRLVPPDAFGLVAMVASVTAVIDLVKDLGFTQATVQRKEIAQEQVSVLFWINLGAGVVLSLLTALLAPVVAAGFGREELFEVMVALSVNSLLGALPLQHDALLRRNLRFGAAAWSSAGASAVAGVIGILAAWSGWGVWALVLRSLVRHAVRAAALWLYLPWRPSRPKRAEIRDLLRFGTRVSAFQVLNYLERNVDNILIGRAAGAEALAFYSKAYEVMRAPLNELHRPLAAVVVPALSRVQDDAERYRGVYVSVTRALFVVTVPLAPLCVLASDWAVPLVLGERWRGAVPVLQWLGAGLLVKPIMNTAIWLLLSQARTRELLRWGVVGFVIALVSFVVGLPDGAVGVARAYTLSEFLVRGPILCFWVARSGPVRVRELLSTLGPGLVCAAVVAVVYIVAAPTFASLGPAGQGLISTGLAVTAAVGSLWVTPVGRHVVRDGLGMVRSLKRRAA